MIQSIEEMFSILEKEDCSPKMVQFDKYGFSRNIQFSVGEVQYCVEWWSNVAHVGVVGAYENYVRFTSMIPDTTWPSFRRGIKLMNHEDFPESADPVMRIALSKLDWQEVTP
jgi:hypothetical protein